MEQASRSAGSHPCFYCTQERALISQKLFGFFKRYSDGEDTPVHVGDSGPFVNEILEAMHHLENLVHQAQGTKTTKDTTAEQERRAKLLKASSPN